MDQNDNEDIRDDSLLTAITEIQRAWRGYDSTFHLFFLCTFIYVIAVIVFIW